MSSAIRDNLIRTAMLKLTEDATVPSSIPISPSIKKFISQAIPGDIINLRRRPESVFGAIIRKANTFLQDEYFPHSSMFIGGDTVIHAVGSGVVKDRLSKMLKTTDAIILRVNTSDQVRNEAVRKMKKSIGRPFGFGKFLKTGVRLLLNKFRQRGRPSVKDVSSVKSSHAVTCSTLIAQSYFPDVKFYASTPVDAILPVDLSKSPHTKKISVYLAEN